ncbi:glycerol-3-phosphate dehydrogenase/oxidase [bacterium]|nr:glycerol-3-phosphate dehydrogenase/oxidase [bacterium]
MTNFQSREKLIDDAVTTDWDIIVIGGGITGAGILREATRQGLKVLLMEQRDFAWGTSSRSTKMVHGGLRYLKEGNIALTRESVVERENLIKELPGLVNNRTFILPFYKDKLIKRLIVHMGLIVYDLLSKKWRKHICSREEMKIRAPHVGKDNLKGGFYINDAVTDDARLVLRVISEALDHGATAINYCKVDRLIKENNRVCGVQFNEAETGTSYTVKGKLVINATGAWADHLRDQVRKKTKDRIRPLRGSHIILSREKLPLVDNISIIHPSDGRPVTTLVWEGRVLMGTTDIDHKGNLDQEASISREETDYLLVALNHQFPLLKLKSEDIISTQAGIRPVIDTGKKNPSQESRDHVIWNEDGLLTVTGGKMTTFRVIALDALKAAQQVIGPLPNLKRKHSIFSDKVNPLPNSKKPLSQESLNRLYGRYGNSVQKMIDQSSIDDLQQISGTETIWAELQWVATEMVVHLDDLLLRRTRLGMLLQNGGKQEMPKIQSICRLVLGWDEEKWDFEEKRYLEIWQKYYSVPKKT